jgi:hypothetical protein
MREVAPAVETVVTSAAIAAQAIHIALKRRTRRILNAPLQLVFGGPARPLP